MVSNREINWAWAMRVAGSCHENYQQNEVKTQQGPYINAVEVLRRPGTFSRPGSHENSAIEPSNDAPWVLDTSKLRKGQRSVRARVCFECTTADWATPFVSVGLGRAKSAPLQLLGGPDITRLTRLITGIWGLGLAGWRCIASGNRA